MIFVHLLLHLLLHLFPHLSFEDDGDADGLIISSYTRRCVSLGIVPHRVSSLSSSSSSPLYSVRRNCLTISPWITATFRPSFVSPICISQPETSFVVSMTLRALRHAHWITTGLRRKVETSSASRPRLQHGVGSSRSDWWKFCLPTSNPDSRR